MDYDKFFEVQDEIKLWYLKSKRENEFIYIFYL